LEQLGSDLRYAVRLLLKSPAFTLVAVASLALGIGANTTIFSLLNALLLKPLPGREPARLATVYTSDFSGPLYSASSYPDYLDFRAQSRSFEGLAAFGVLPVVLTDRGESRRVVGQFVTANFFEVLGLGAAYGRALLPAEDDEAAPPAAVLSDAYWRSRFAADPSVVGREIALNGRPFTVVGVGPAGFSGMLRGLSADIFVPLAMRPSLGGGPLEGRGNRGLLLFGRLRPGASVADVRAELGVVARRLHASYRDHWTNRLDQPRVVSVLPEDASRVVPVMRGPVTAFLGVLLAAVGAVLLIACTNVASLLLARASARRRELAVRVALGASRAQLVRQLLAESVVLVGVAGALGVGLAALAQRLILAFQPPLPVTLALGLELDLRVLLFALLLSLATGVLFGLWPALAASLAHPVESLTARGGEPVSRRRVSVRDALVVAQVAGSLVLLIAASLFLRSLANARAIDAGFDPEGALIFSLDLGAQGYDSARGGRFFTALQERLEHVPGVEAVGLASLLPLSLGAERRGLHIEGYTPGPGEDLEVHSSFVGPGYFRAMRGRLTRGREYDVQDTPETPGVVIVNEAFVRRYWPGRDGLGERIVTWDERRQAERPFAVVGIARDGKYRSLGEDPKPFVFYPQSQLYRAELAVVVRAQGDPKALAASLRREVKALDATLPVYDVKTLTEHLGTALFPARAAATLVGLSGSLALLLAAIGLYGVLSYAVSLRTREIGVRVALGAQRRDVASLVVGRGLRLVCLGTALGLALAFVLTRFLSFLLYGVSALDPLTFAGVPALLLGVALVAAWEPARRALRIDPALSLREE
jgi:macrolide transport system ATP-binding/permease protein